MRQALLLIESKGKPAERVTGDMSSMIAKWKAFSTPDAHATLFELHKRKHKHIAAAPAAAVPTPAPAPQAPAPQPKQTFTQKGK